MDLTVQAKDSCGESKAKRHTSTFKDVAGIITVLSVACKKIKYNSEETKIQVVTEIPNTFNYSKLASTCLKVCCG